MFTRAVKSRSKLRLGLIGPSGSGKTYSALAIASGLGKRIALIDSEHGSASKYADLFQFDVAELTSFSPQHYIDALKAAVAAEYDVVVIDSLSHAWSGRGGALELVDQANARSKTGNSFAAWREVTPLHNAMVEAIVTCQSHVICTMRSKMEYAVEKDDRGKTTVRKVGLSPVQRDGMEYEFDVIGDIDQSHTLVVNKSRIPQLADAVIRKPGGDLAAQLRTWLDAGDEPVSPPPAPVFGAPPPSDGLASTGQLNLMRQMFAASGLKPNYWEEVKAKYGVDSSTQLKRPQADEVIAHLKSVLDRKGEAE
jgi:hypothetical protein